jgi:hypothetical protein
MTNDREQGPMTAALLARLDDLARVVDRLRPLVGLADADRGLAVAKGLVAVDKAAAALGRHADRLGATP